MSPYWSHEVCGWVQGAPPDLLDTPWAGHGLPLPHEAVPVSSADVIVLPDGRLPAQRPSSTVPVDA